jgi:hypothetical protein
MMDHISTVTNGRPRGTPAGGSLPGLPEPHGVCECEQPDFRHIAGFHAWECRHCHHPPNPIAAFALQVEWAATHD